MKDYHVFYNREAHVSRLLTAFHMLDQRGEANVSFIENVNNFRSTPHSQVVELEVDGNVYAFDMCDAFALNNEKGKAYLNKVALYFKRSYLKEMDAGLSAELMDKIRPYGFDFYTTFPGNPMDERSLSVKGRIKQTLRTLSGYDKCSYAEAFERKADQTRGNPQIIFMTRLWDPDEISLEGDLDPELRSYREYMIEERNRINADRTKIVRELRRIYGNNFVGGIQSSPFAERYSPDILIPKELTRKKTYLHKMQSADICIGSMGLHKSTGWKTGEYIAASRAIVAERLVYNVPGDFAAYKNYIPFDTVEECLSAVDRLYHDPDAVYAMKKANEQYYQQYLEPAAQLKNALLQCEG